MFCAAFQTARQDQFPLRLQCKPIPSYHLVVAVIHKGDQILITQRQTDGLLGGLWEFPNGEINNTEDPPEDVCRQIIQEDFNLQIKSYGEILE